MIILATPTRDTVTAGFAADLVKLTRRHLDVRWLAALGIYIANLRNQCAAMALQTGASHLLFLDSDMRFPEDTLDRLLAADRPIVAANSVQRTEPHWWNSRLDGQPVSSVGKTGLQRVDSTGCGVMLIETHVFPALDRPWFSTPYDGQTHVGEDVYFCKHAHAAGVGIWIDHDLSQSVTHQGTVDLGVQSQDVMAFA